MSSPLLVSFYSHKGGVGKTTCIHNMASILARDFKLKVLLVDLDTQGSLTGLVMRKQFEEIGRKKVENIPHDRRKSYTKGKHFASLGEDEFMETKRSKRTTVYEIFRGEKTKTCKHHLAYVEANYKKVVSEIEPITINEGTDGKFLFIPGDLRIRTIESEISEAIAALNSGASFASYYSKMPGVICRVLRDVAKNHAVDLVLLDFSPSPTPFNQAAFMGSDYFIMNCLADFLSRRSIKTLASLLDEWEELCDAFRDPSLGEFMLPSCPKFLGPVISRIKLHNTDVTMDKKDKIELIKQEIKTYLTKFQDRNDPISTPLEDPPLIRDFNRLGDKAEETGIPICYIQPEDIPKSSKKKNITDPLIIEGSKLFLNSYFAAIISLFSNLSNAHHLLLRNVFRLNYEKIFPSENWEMNTDSIKVGKTEKLKRDEAFNICDLFDSKDSKVSEYLKSSNHDISPDIYHAFSRAKEKPDEIKEFLSLNKILKEKKNSLLAVQEKLSEKKNPIFEKFLVRNFPKDPQLCKLSYRVSSQLDPKEKKDNQVQNNNVNSQEEMSTVAQKADTIAKTFLDAYREVRKAACTLANHLARKEAKEQFISIVEHTDMENLYGESCFKICAEAANKNVHLWGQSSDTGMVTLLDEIFPQEGGDVIDILCETKSHKKVFCQLLKEHDKPIKEPRRNRNNGTNENVQQIKNSKSKPKSEISGREDNKRRFQSRDKSRNKSREDSEEKFVHVKKKVKGGGSSSKEKIKTGHN